MLKNRRLENLRGKLNDINASEEKAVLIFFRDPNKPKNTPCRVKAYIAKLKDSPGSKEIAILFRLCKDQPKLDFMKNCTEPDLKKFLWVPFENVTKITHNNKTIYDTSDENATRGEENLRSKKQNSLPTQHSATRELTATKLINEDQKNAPDKDEKRANKRIKKKEGQETDAMHNKSSPYKKSTTTEQNEKDIGKRGNSENLVTTESQQSKTAMSYDSKDKFDQKSETTEKIIAPSLPPTHRKFSANNANNNIPQNKFKTHGVHKNTSQQKHDANVFCRDFNTPRQYIENSQQTAYQCQSAKENAAQKKHNGQPLTQNSQTMRQNKPEEKKSRYESENIKDGDDTSSPSDEEELKSSISDNDFTDDSILDDSDTNEFAQQLAAQSCDVAEEDKVPLALRNAQIDEVNANEQIKSLNNRTGGTGAIAYNEDDYTVKVIKSEFTIHVVKPSKINPSLGEVSTENNNYVGFTDVPNSN